MIIGLFGNMSSGKTLFAVKLMYDELIKKPDLKILSNSKLGFKHIYFNEENLIEKVMKNQEIFEDSIFFLDEAHNYIESRRSSSNLSIKFVQFLTQLGKLNCTLILTSQMESQIDVRFRTLMDVRGYCSRTTMNGTPIYSSERILPFPILIQVDFIFILKGGLQQVQGTKFYDLKDYYNLYKTKEIILVDRDKYKVKPMKYIS